MSVPCYEGVTTRLAKRRLIVRARASDQSIWDFRGFGKGIALEQLN
jgi:hypothetical protein